MSVFSLSITVKIPQWGIFSNFIERLNYELLQAEKDISKALLSEAQDKSHRYRHRTRNLRASTNIQGTMLDSLLVLGVDNGGVEADYAEYIVRGTSRWEPDPFIDLAYQRKKEYIIGRIEKAVLNAVKSFNKGKRW